MKKLKNLTVLFILTTLFVVAGGPSRDVLASPDTAIAPDLASAATFVALAGSTLTNTGSGVYVGDVGVWPGTAVIGFPPGMVINGAIHAGDGVAEAAQLDATNAYIDLGLETCDTDLTGVNLGGKTYPPGVYCFNTSGFLTGDLVLDAVGDPNAVWVFKTGSTLITATGSNVNVINDGSVLNVFWWVGSSATLGTRTRFIGNIIADQSITMVTGAGLRGRALALHGAVTVNSNGSPPITNDPLLIYYFPLLYR